MKQFLLSILLAIALFLGGMTSGFAQSVKTTYDFSTAASLTKIGYYYTQADITIDGTAFRIYNGINGDYSNATSGGASNSKCLQKDGAGGESLTLQRVDGQPFQFYGIWVKHQSMNSYSSYYTLPPWYTLTASTFSYKDMTPMTAGTAWNNYTGSTQTISAGTDGITTTSIQISFQAILYFWIDDISVGPVPPSLSTITTQAATGISSTTATGNGNITNLGSPNPTTYGVCWNTSGTPTISNSKTDKGTAPELNTSGNTVIGLWKVGTTIYGARVGDA